MTLFIFQILDWIYKKGAVEVSEMTNLPKSFRESMVKEVEISRLRQIEVNISKTREAVKFVFEVKNISKKTKFKKIYF